VQVPEDEGGDGLAEWLELPAHDRLALDSDLRQLRAVAEEVDRTDARLAEVARQEPRVRLLMPLPGVNYVVALGLLAAFGPISRFPDGDHAAAYLGLVPSTRRFGRCCYQGPITKAGRSPARWVLAQSARHGARHPGPLGAFFPAAGGADEPERGDHGAGPQAGRDRLPDAEAQRAVPVRPPRVDAGEVYQAAATGC
jgi:transposase